MNKQGLIRVVAAAFALTTLSFAAGVAGDLSLADGPTSGERVVLRLPPELPPDTVRAAPLPPLVSTAAAEARPMLVRSRIGAARGGSRIAPAQAEKPQREQVHAAPKMDLDRAPKTDERASTV